MKEIRKSSANQRVFLGFYQMIFGLILIFSISINCVYSQSTELSGLLSEIHPTIYIQDGKTSVHGNGAPEVIVCDVASVSSLYYEDDEYMNVKLIKIKINNNEQLSDINTSNFISLGSLQYIYIEYQYDVCGNMSETCLEQLVQSHIINTNTNISVHTGLSIPN